MNSADRYTRPPRLPPSLMNGDRLKQPDFHRRYLEYPEDVKIELIGGVVYVASPQRRAHGRYQLLLGRAALTYEDATPGVEVLDNTTTILGEESEPQPDLSLRILSAFQGRSRETEDDYVEVRPR
jgi:Uma2 family endonuclease